MVGIIALGIVAVAEMCSGVGAPAGAGTAGLCVSLTTQMLAK